MSGLGLELWPLSFSSFSEIACRSSGMPELGGDFVNQASSAAIAAALMCSGVSKSGSPAPKPQTSSPSDFIAFALLSTDKEREGVRLFAREESCIKPSQDYMCQPPISRSELGCLFDPQVVRTRTRCRPRPRIIRTDT